MNNFQLWSFQKTRNVRRLNIWPSIRIMIKNRILFLKEIWSPQQKPLSLRHFRLSARVFPQHHIFIENLPLQHKTALRTSPKGLHLMSRELFPTQSGEDQTCGNQREGRRQSEVSPEPTLLKRNTHESLQPLFSPLLLCLIWNCGDISSLQWDFSERRWVQQ